MCFHGRRFVLTSLPVRHCVYCTDVTQMAKNKGLMPKRKKEQRNPRVKNKLKYRKAKIRRKGAVSHLNALVIVYTEKKNPVAVAWCTTCTCIVV